MEYEMNNGGRRPRIEPIYQVGDVVTFPARMDKDSEAVEVEGVIHTVDRYGWFGDDSQPYYDISTPEIHYKHVAQSSIIGKK